MRQRFRSICLAIGLATAAMLYGMLSHRNGLPPYGLVKRVWFAVSSPFAPDNSLDSVRAAIDPAVIDDTISIRDSIDVQITRAKLIDILWGTELPQSIPDSIVSGIHDERCDDLPNLDRIDKLTVTMEFGLESIVYHFIPKKPNASVVLYHEGHDVDFFGRKDQIAMLLERGYSVVAFCMPLVGINNQPVVALPRIGPMKLTVHDHLKYLQPQHGFPMKYFIEPVVVVLNYLERSYDYRHVAMYGISGGGWTTTLAAAVDPRIQQSFPVAGSYPIFLRSFASQDWGDWEQTAATLYGSVNYLELYVLGSTGTGRQQLQIFNKHDPCCFEGARSEVYKDLVALRVRSLGPGEFGIHVDETNREHSISDESMRLIIDELEQTRAVVSR